MCGSVAISATACLCVAAACVVLVAATPPVLHICVRMSHSRARALNQVDGNSIDGWVGGRGHKSVDGSLQM